jgi:tRNA nucleotidyltransferase (CCA-adding enzyme)
MTVKIASSTDTVIDKNALKSLQLFNKLGLYSTIFTDPTAPVDPVPSTTNWHFAYECLEELKMNETPGSIYHSLVRSEESKYLAWILSALTPWAGLPQTPPVKMKGKPLLPLGAMVAREGLKAENKICSVAGGAFKHFEEISALKDAIKSKSKDIHERDTIGMTIRRWDTQGGHWRLQAIFALLVEAMKSGSAGKYTPPPFNLCTNLFSQRDTVQ